MIGFIWKWVTDFLNYLVKLKHKLEIQNITQNKEDKFSTFNSSLENIGHM